MTLELTDQTLGFEDTLASLRADREAGCADGKRFQKAVLRHAKEIPSWEIVKCWNYEE